MEKFREIIAISTIAVLSPRLVSAQITNPLGGTSDLPTLLERIIDIIILLATPIIVIAVIYAGFLFVTAGGSEQKISTAKKVILWALVGALILLGARVIAATVQGTVDSFS